MYEEIERKFRVTSTAFIAIAASSHYIHQGYLNTDPARTVRIRIQDSQGILTVKGIGDETGASRFEWEKDVELAEARLLMGLAEDHPIEKRRYRVFVGTHWWDVDEFMGANQTLILAEIELTHLKEKFERPEWIGEEVTGDRRFYNSYLSKHPYSTWEEK
jgi:CYTH domain-containing protein